MEHETKWLLALVAVCLAVLGLAAYLKVSNPCVEGDWGNSLTYVCKERFND